jgi:hypothetical protein
LKSVLIDARLRIIQLANQPDRYTCDTDEDSNAAASYSQLEESYTFRQGFFAPKPPLPGRTHRALTVVHEAIHGVFDGERKRYQAQRSDSATRDLASTSSRQTSDFSFPHGVIGVLPYLPGVDPLGNPESIAAVVLSIGFGELQGVQKLAERNTMDVDGFDRDQLRVMRTVGGYVRLVMYTALDDTFAKAYPPTSLDFPDILEQLLAEQLVNVRPAAGFTSPSLALFRALRSMWLDGAKQLDSLRIIRERPLAAVRHVYIPSSAARELIAKAEAVFASSPTQKLPPEILRPLATELLAEHLLQAGGARLTGSRLFQIPAPRAFLHALLDSFNLPLI